MTVLIVVTHLLGTGHLRRAMTLASSFAQAGHDVRLVSGGLPVPGLNQTGVEVWQMPPLASDGTNFTTLLTENGGIADAQYLSARHAALCTALDPAPDILITELFPFGRRVLREEFMALLTAALDLPVRPLTLCSIRDILAPPSRPDKAQKTHDLIQTYYDGVLVHSDPSATPLSASWPVTPALERQLHYTGFVAPPPPEPHPDTLGQGEVVVSAGGGPVGAALFHAAAKAAGLLPDLTWRLLIGGQNPQPLITELSETGPKNLHVEAARPDFRQMLCHAACSVSMAGYNTALDLLQTGVPALLIPFDDGGEVEQTLRAQSLSKLPAMDVMRSSDCTPDTLAQAASHLMTQPRRGTTGFAMQGARDTVRIATSLREAM